MVLVLFFLTYQLSCGMRCLILSVPMSLLVLKENPGPHFVQRLFFLMNISLNSMYLVGLYICFLFSFASLSRIENISIISNNAKTTVSGGSRQQLSSLLQNSE